MRIAWFLLPVSAIYFVLPSATFPFKACTILLWEEYICIWNISQDYNYLVKSHLWMQFIFPSSAINIKTPRQVGKHRSSGSGWEITVFILENKDNYKRKDANTPNPLAFPLALFRCVGHFESDLDPKRCIITCFPVICTVQWCKQLLCTPHALLLKYKARKIGFCPVYPLSIQIQEIDFECSFTYLAHTTGEWQLV